jgi:hypothetical protein
MAKAKVMLLEAYCRFIAHGTAVTIVNYDRSTFIVQATGGSMGPRYVLQILFCEKSKLLKHSNHRSYRKISSDLESSLF